MADLSRPDRQLRHHLHRQRRHLHLDQQRPPKRPHLGSSETLSPNYQDLLIDAYGTSTWKLSGNSDNITGTIFVPNATFNVTGASSDLFNVFLEGNNATMSGNNWTLTGTGPSTGGNSGSQLIQ